jgi:hypothetical protein
MRHFTKKTVLAVVACMTCLMSFAQSETPISESATLVVSTNDGQEYRILLVDQKDIRFQFYGGNMTLTYEPYTGTPSTIVIGRENVKDIRIDDSQSSGIAQPLAKKGAVHFSITGQNRILVSGLQLHDKVQMVTVNGRSVFYKEAYNDADMTIDMNSQPHGIYIVSVNKRFTFKIVKP